MITFETIFRNVVKQDVAGKISFLSDRRSLTITIFAQRLISKEKNGSKKFPREKIERVGPKMRQGVSKNLIRGGKESY